MFEDNDTLKRYFDETVKNVAQIVKKSSQLPTNKADIIYLNTFSDYNDHVNNINKILQCNIRDLAKCVNCTPKWPSKMLKDDFQKDESDQDLLETLIDVNDYLFELLEHNLNEALHGNRSQQPNKSNQLLEKFNMDQSSYSNTEKCKNILKKDLCPVKPQLLWKNRLSNDTNPFIPSLTTKPHALIPLDIDQRKLREICDNEIIINLHQRHPYSYEIYKLEYNLNKYKRQYTKEIRKPREFKPEYHYIDTLDQLNDFLSFFESSNIDEIAVDLEAHSLHSYLGFVCLMQISTRKEDFIIDTIALHDNLTILNQIFTNPKILKIFHGADSDIKWLQRDFNIYVVNMFDTYMGSKKLPFPRRNLAYLLRYYCNVDTDKSFQKADWRIRPLTEDMVKYARIDTHYLHYIYDRMIVDLLDCDQKKGQILQDVLNNCKTVSLNVYEKPPCSDIAIIKFKEKFPRNLSPSKICCLEELFHWRHSLAQQHDESPEYVLPQHMLIELADRLPKDKEGIIAYCTPPSPLLIDNITHVCKIIKTWRENEYNINNDIQPLQKSDNIITKRITTTDNSLINYFELGAVGFEPSLKVSSNYISEESKSTNLEAPFDSLPLEISSNLIKSLKIERNGIYRKDVKDLQHSFVGFYALYNKATMETNVVDQQNKTPVDIIYKIASERFTTKH